MFDYVFDNVLFCLIMWLRLQQQAAADNVGKARPAEDCAQMQGPRGTVSATLITNMISFYFVPKLQTNHTLD
jgi:hypothetical protein